ncbi:MAG: helix-turn-helix transcriptional regulator [Myxococcota bacterium]
MPRPSAPLLSWLRDMLKQKGINTAHVADASGLPRARVRKILAGTEDMTVDELMLLSGTLELDPSDLSPQAIAEAEAAAKLKADAEPPVPDEVPRVDPWGNQPEQLFKTAFEFGCDFIFLVDTARIGASGVPEAVLRQYQGRDLPIRLDAAYHKYNDPKYDADGITLTLSFDKLYDCHFQWAAVRQVAFFPHPPDPVGDDEDTGSSDEPEPGVPFLRLVT